MHNEMGRPVVGTRGQWQSVLRNVLIVVMVFLGCLAARCWLHYFQSHIDDYKILSLLRCMFDKLFTKIPKLDWFMCLESSKLTGKSVYLVGAHFYTQLAISGVILIVRAWWRPLACLLSLFIMIAVLINGIGALAALIAGDLLPTTVFGFVAMNAVGNFCLLKWKLK